MVLIMVWHTIIRERPIITVFQVSSENTVKAKSY